MVSSEKFQTFFIMTHTKTYYHHSDSSRLLTVNSAGKGDCFQSKNHCHYSWKCVGIIHCLYCAVYCCRCFLLISQAGRRKGLARKLTSNTTIVGWNYDEIRIFHLLVIGVKKNFCNCSRRKVVTSKKQFFYCCTVQNVGKYGINLCLSTMFHRNLVLKVRWRSSVYPRPLHKDRDKREIIGIEKEKKAHYCNDLNAFK